MDLEKPYLGVMFALLLFLGVGNLWDHRVAHEFPYGYFASDTFQQQTRAEGIKDAGSYLYEPPFIVKGYTDVVGYYPPVIHHLGILLHYSSGVPLYDTIYLMVFLSAILATFVMYMIIRETSKLVAILSLPLSVLLFFSKSFIGFTWGHWASIVGQLFLICIFWSLMKKDVKQSWVLLGISFAGLALSHTSELVYGAGFVILYGAYLACVGQFSKDYVKALLYAALVSGVFAFYNLLVFVQSFQVVNPYTFQVSKDWGGTPIFALGDFGWLLLIMAVGLVVSVLKHRKVAIPFLIGMFMLLIGYTNYIGFGIRAFQPRLFWPLYFMFFLGFGLYVAINFLSENARCAAAMGIAVVLLILFSGAVQVSGIPSYAKLSGQGLMDEWHWEGFQWISQNTPNDAKIYYFYGDVYGQDAILRNSKRFHAQVVPEDFIKGVQNGTIRRVFETEVPADHGAGMPYWKSFPIIGLHQREDMGKFMWKTVHDVCDFDYFVFDKLSRIEALSQYNLLIANSALGNNSTLVFQNDVVAIVRNDKKGGECIEEGTF